MSKIGKKSIPVPAGVDVKVSGSLVSVKGPKGELSRPLPAGFGVTVTDGAALIAPAAGAPVQAITWGLERALLKNMIVGVSEGFKETLELNGVGYKAAVKGTDLELNLGFSHPVLFPLPAGVSAGVEKNLIILSGIDREAVGQTAAQIRALKKPEPYKAHGVKYGDEVIRRKAGKKAATAA